MIRRSPKSIHLTIAGCIGSPAEVPPTVSSSANLLLRSLDAEDFAAIRPSLSCRSLQQGEVLLEAEAPIETLCFLEAGVVSFHEMLEDGSRVGVGIIGFEGLTGWSVLLGCERSPHEATVAIGGGTALHIPAEALLAACRARPRLNTLLLLYVQSFITQMGRTISSNLNDRLERRLARWLLMNHDRIDGDEIALTHEQLGVMLGVRRATVTDALHILEGEHFIRSTRGRIVIRDRAGLIDFAGNAYGAAEEAYSRLIAQFPKPRD